MTRSLTYLYRSFAVITANRMDSKFISTICLSPMPLPRKCSTISFIRQDFPQRRIPVMTLIISVP